ncbi:Gfo/Idh/MocA family protein [Streptosporangium sp. NBC_01469]|uniref:Gfo/Idh/MocA family protein n=1 Tax=Streptosporangium sp. NBC_01469 TaxID=2903898 RepID=UPI002E2CAEE5|nr:Gfo/Idh/MocA family oxidoreductase [Streptosporangium sp. NBC_01469]
MIKVAVAGLGFGRQFVPIYRDHPLVSSVVVADPIEGSSLDDVLADPTVDAVHIVTGLTDRADHIVAALEAGKHVAGTVPMALSLADVERVLDARELAGTTYMMMETAVYTRACLYAAGLAFGEINHARGVHTQDMTGWPGYWRGLPPMYYATHAIAPILHLLDAPAVEVTALGGGLLEPENRGDYDNEFAVESALVRVAGRNTVVELTRSLYQVARPYAETFSVYGDRLGFEWDRDMVLHTLQPPTKARGRQVTTEPVIPPDRPDLLPEEIRAYTSGGHDGSHPHLVHEFVSAVVEGRPPVIDHTRAANWTAVGIAAHASAQRGGVPVAVPHF